MITKLRRKFSIHLIPPFDGKADEYIHILLRENKGQTER